MYRLILKSRARKSLLKLPRERQEQIAEQLRALATEPRPPGARKLQGREGYRIRVGDYRVIYAVMDEDEVVEVRVVGHRRDVYR
ncbi:MAG: type II toxin-antitoxin system RelE/ParE family toxin [Alphaproteobacteria bacterium]|nr:type II toxin-antitoxin system RelE/ParE family toxin [Alphaproteobacteria bacterium]